MWGLGDVALTGDERPDDLVGPLLQMLERLKQELVPLDRLAKWAEVTDDAERGELMRASVRLFRAYERECRKHRWLEEPLYACDHCWDLIKHPWKVPQLITCSGCHQPVLQGRKCPCRDNFLRR